MMIKCYSDRLKLSSKMLSMDSLRLVDAESVCLSHEKNKWEEIINNAYKSKGMQKIIKLEKQGITDMQEGRYRL